MSTATRRALFAWSGAMGASAALVPLLVRGQDASEDIARYTGGILAINNMLLWFYQEETQLTSNASEADLLDELWRIDVLGGFSVPRAAQVALTEIVPPAAFQESYDLFAEAVDYAVLSGEQMELALLNGDQEALAAAALYLGQSSELLNQAGEAIPSAAELAG